MSLLGDASTMRKHAQGVYLGETVKVTVPFSVFGKQFSAPDMKPSYRDTAETAGQPVSFVRYPAVFDAGFKKAAKPDEDTLRTLGRDTLEGEADQISWLVRISGNDVYLSGCCLVAPLGHAFAPGVSLNAQSSFIEAITFRINRTHWATSGHTIARHLNNWLSSHRGPGKPLDWYHYTSDPVIEIDATKTFTPPASVPKSDRTSIVIPASDANGLRNVEPFFEKLDQMTPLERWNTSMAFGYKSRFPGVGFQQIAHIEQPFARLLGNSKSAQLKAIHLSRLKDTARDATRAVHYLHMAADDAIALGVPSAEEALLAAGTVFRSDAPEIDAFDPQYVIGALHLFEYATDIAMSWRKPQRELQLAYAKFIVAAVVRHPNLQREILEHLCVLATGPSVFAYAAQEGRLEIRGFLTAILCSSRTYAPELWKRFSNRIGPSPNLAPSDWNQILNCGAVFADRYDMGSYWS